MEAAEDAGGASDGASSASRGRLPVVPLELPLAALSPRGREERGPQPGSQSAGQSGQSARSSCSAEELPPLQKLRDLSFVAVREGQRIHMAFLRTVDAICPCLLVWHQAYSDSLSEVLTLPWGG